MVCMWRDPGPGASRNWSAGASGTLGIKSVRFPKCQRLLDLRTVKFLGGIMKGFQTVELSPLKEFTSLVHINSL